MRDLFMAVTGWNRGRTQFAFATLVGVRNAAPAPLGASMAATVDGTIAGDIGAGCYEGEIVEAAMETARDGTTRILTIDLTGDDLISGGTGCGGLLEVVTWRPPDGFDLIADAIVAGRTDVTFPIAYERDGSMREFVMNLPARRTLIVVGGTTLAQELA
ncbi:MAG: XdhC family protein, partial [Vulcanimicrobiaceae bacterium]